MFANTFAGVLDFADRFEETLATILKKINQMENHITVLARKVEEIQIIQKRQHEKMMEALPLHREKLQAELRSPDDDVRAD